MSLRIQKVTGYVVPKSNINRRSFYSTYSTANGIFYTGSKVEIDETIERLETDPLKPHDYKLDLWGKVVSVNGTPVTTPTYIAITYHNSSSFTPLTLCDKYYNVVTDEEPPVSEPTAFPDFILVKLNTDGTVTEKKYRPE